VEHEACYIDGRICTGARLADCGECRIAKKLNTELIRTAKTPLELTLAHHLTKEQKRLYRGILLDDGNSYMCCLHETPRIFDWCEDNCIRYYSCDTVAWAGDDLKAAECS